jgi:DNA-binding FadR family transcriptional regulator
MIYLMNHSVSPSLSFPMTPIALDSELLEYIVRQGFRPGDRLPTLNELRSSDHLGISISKVREQLEVARALGFVEVKSKTGMRMREYTFTPAVQLSLMFALALDPHAFELFSQLRTHVETAFWVEACQRLQPEDLEYMRALLNAADAKLNGETVRIPVEEHREFHLTVFRRLENPFVMGILEAYWEAYNAVELNRYADYRYLREVWDYHARILDAICAGDFQGARDWFVAHTHLIHHQPRMIDMERRGEEIQAHESTSRPEQD